LRITPYFRPPVSMQFEILPVLCLTFLALYLHRQDLNNSKTPINVKALLLLVEIDRFEGIDHRSYPQ